MKQLQIDFYRGTRFCISCEKEINEQWAIDRQEKQPDSNNWVCSDCWNNLHYTTRIAVIEGKIKLNGFFRNAKKTQSKKQQTKKDS
jgi:hypothetical protein